MTVSAINQLITALPDHQVSIKPRPDGMYLLTISKDGENVFVKAVDKQSVISEAGVHALQREILRDRKLVSGEVNWKGTGAHWVSRKLPTFTGAPVNPTAAKMMWSRRNLDSLRPTA
ncbi:MULTISPECIES: hypothetical protein [Pseudomonas]|uniref:DUF3509 domain-containing protein n=2 Tax=Pseudomonadaceae TaxID=135621 RepID=A0A0D0L802_9PSED|nr:MULTISPECIES: hypothetical protein [Pseudomonas]KIQ06044.1 hypothetical protein RU08_02300 [Pseudomonas fulva]MCW2293561.1 hypothetical protein [Pseudomonas sp. BIGb0408]NYH71868.1 hypothetical protein [Pseudomonas flavescens]